MKVELKEDAVVLRPETEFERKALKSLRKRGVSEIRFENDWDQDGGLVLNHRKHPWDR